MNGFRIDATSWAVITFVVIVLVALWLLSGATYSLP